MTFRRDRERRSNHSALLPAASGSRLVSSRTARAGRALEKKTRGRISDGPQLGLRGPRALDLKDPPVPGRGALEARSYAKMTAHVMDLASRIDAPVGAVLEGGYDLDALAESVLAMIGALGGQTQVESIAPDPLITSRVAAHVGHFWGL